MYAMPVMMSALYGLEGNALQCLLRAVYISFCVEALTYRVEGTVLCRTVVFQTE
jgi:hypothetical protein